MKNSNFAHSCSLPMKDGTFDLKQEGQSGEVLNNPTLSELGILVHFYIHFTLIRSHIT